MYVIKWTREVSKEDHLKCITPYHDAIWRDLKEAMLFNSPEEAQDYVIGNFSLNGESRESILSWLAKFTKVLYIHPLNIG